MSDADYPALIEAWSATASDFVALAQALDDADWDRPTPCPGWSVGDVVAHIVAIDADLLGDAATPHEPDWSALPHVGESPFSRYTETGVDSRRGRDREAVVAELADVVGRRRGQLATDDRDPHTELPWIGGGTRTLHQVLRMRTFDTWAHEQDIRSALGRPGGEGTPGAQVTAHVLASALPMVVGKRLQAAPGTTVRLVVTGAVPFERSVGIDDGGRAVFTDPVEHPTTRVEMGWMTFVALGCGRVGAEEAAAGVIITGDADLGRRMLPALRIAP